MKYVVSVSLPVFDESKVFKFNSESDALKFIANTVAKFSKSNVEHEIMLKAARS